MGIELSEKQVGLYFFIPVERYKNADFALDDERYDPEIPADDTHFLELTVTSNFDDNAVIAGEVVFGGGAAFPSLEVIVDIARIIGAVGTLVGATRWAGSKLTNTIESWNKKTGGYVKIDREGAKAISIASLNVDAIDSLEIVGNLDIPSAAKAKKMEHVPSSPALYITAILEKEGKNKDRIHLVSVNEKGQITDVSTQELAEISNYFYSDNR